LCLYIFYVNISISSHYYLNLKGEHLFNENLILYLQNTNHRQYEDKVSIFESQGFHKFDNGPWTLNFNHDRKSFFFGHGHGPKFYHASNRDFVSD
jgi:hypothetical protein